jgi:site-specific recombinase XerD
MGNRVFYTFWLYKSKKNKRNEAPVYLRLTINGKKTELSTGIMVSEDKWNSKKQQVRGNALDSNSKNKVISDLRNKITSIQDELNRKGVVITSELFKSKLLGDDKEVKTLLQAFDKYLDVVKAKACTETSIVPFKKLLIVKNRIVEFIYLEFNRKDIGLEELDYGFIQKFDLFLKNEKGYQLNTASASCQRLKRVIKNAISNEWLTKDPFDDFQCKREDVLKQYLTREDLIKLIEKEIQNNRLDEVRDVFVFCCFTGLAYADINKLSKKDILIKEDGRRLLKINRTKTNIVATIPLNEIALRLIAKYDSHPKVIYENKLLPVISNQKTNAYLKEIADIAGIEKHLTHHIARHTFATYYSEMGIPIEVTSKILGHKNIKTTSIYYKVTDVRILNEADKLLNDFTSNRIVNEN